MKNIIHLDNYIQNIHPPKNQTISYPLEASDWCSDIEQGSFWFNHRNVCIATLIKTYNAPTPLFDIGGGNGVVAIFLRKQKIKTVLIEPSPLAVKRAIKRGITSLCAPFEAVKFKPGTIPAVGIFDVLEHIKSTPSWFKKIHEILIPGGMIFITVPAFQFAWSNEDTYAGHYRRYSRKQLKADLQAQGFEVEYISYFFSLLLVPIMLFRTLPTIMHLRDTISVADEQRSHAAGKSWLKTALLKILSFEPVLLAHKIPLPFGSSLIAVARKSP